jgi:hypothetical protein
MKVIFLDIDGVLNNSDDSDLHEGEGTMNFYSPNCVAILNSITGWTKAKIVVSSTWRLGVTLVDLQVQLRSMGITGQVIGKTEDLRVLDGYRGNEILKWIKDNKDILSYNFYHEYKSYVILDDDTDMLLWQKDNFVHTDGNLGLTDLDAAKAIRILLKGDDTSGK